jgi:hypothetical protein
MRDIHGGFYWATSSRFAESHRHQFMILDEIKQLLSPSSVLTSLIQKWLASTWRLRTDLDRKINEDINSIIDDVHRFNRISGNGGGWLGGRGVVNRACHYCELFQVSATLCAVSENVWRWMHVVPHHHGHPPRRMSVDDLSFLGSL